LSPWYYVEEEKCPTILLFKFLICTYFITIFCLYQILIPYIYSFNTWSCEEWLKCNWTWYDHAIKLSFSRHTIFTYHIFQLNNWEVKNKHLKCKFFKMICMSMNPTLCVPPCLVIVHLGFALLHITNDDELLKKMNYFVKIKFHLNDLILNEFS
jgi:hypothetical protein